MDRPPAVSVPVPIRPRPGASGSPRARVWTRPAFRLTGLLIVAIGLTGAGMASKRFYDYVFGYTPTAWNPASLAGGSRLGPYYLDWRGDWADRQALREATREGVLATALAREVDGRVRQDPVIVIQSGLAVHDLMLDARDDPSRLAGGAPEAGDPELERILRDQVAWVAGEGLTRLSSGLPVWPCYWTAGSYGLIEPWVSAMTQGQAISLLLRAHQAFGDPRYLALATEAVEAFFDPSLPIVSRGPTGAELFLEEYPTVPDSRVLNGALCAWLGLWDYVRVTGDPRVLELCERTRQVLESRLPEYETTGALAGWTRYDALQGRPTSPNYQEIHASLAEAMAGITGSPVWEDRALRWRAAADRVDLRIRVFGEVLRAKTKKRLFGGEETPRARTWEGPAGG